MSLYLLDTDHISLYDRGHPRVVQRVALRVADRLAISVLTLEEQLKGWQTVLGRACDDLTRANLYVRMARAAEMLFAWSVLPFSLNAMTVHAGLVRQRLNIGSNDLKIAATALDVGATVVTRNRRDFGRVGGLVIEDWSV